MKRLAMYIGVMLIGTSIALSGCGAEKAAAPKAPLVKSMVIGETESDVKNTFSGTVHGFLNRLWHFRWEAGSCSAMSHPVSGSAQGRHSSR